MIEEKTILKIGKTYKASRKIPDLGISNTQFFQKEEEALEWLKQW